MEEVTRRQFSVGVCLGRGGFGEVYRAKMASAAGLESDVAVKVLRRDLDPAGQAIQRLRDEGKLLARLNHPTILRVIDLVLLDGCVSLVTEYVDGEDLGACLVGDDPMPIRAQLEVLAAVASALDAAWNAPGFDGRPLQLVHRDIKPSNIRISRHGEVKLLDFGIARSDNVEREAKTATNLMVGSPSYMAPERFIEADIHPESDVFALGAVLYEGLMGGIRFYENLPMPVQSALSVDDERYDIHFQKRMAALPADVPEGVRELLVELLAYEYTKRPSARDVVKKCEELADRTKGTTLARWARAHEWKSPDLAQGPLEGRTLTEGTMTRSTFVDRSGAPSSGSPSGGPVTQPVPVKATRTQTSEATAKGPPIGMGAIAAVGVLLVALVVVGVGVIGGIAGVGLYGMKGAASATTPTAATDATSTAPTADGGTEKPADVAPAATDAPSEPSGTAETPAATPPETSAGDATSAGTAPATASSSSSSSGKRHPVSTAGTAGTSTTTEPATTPVAPPPDKPAATASSASIGTGKVDFQPNGDVTASLVGNGKTIPLPGSAPQGAYEVRASFAGGDPVVVAHINVIADGDHLVSCNARMQRCQAR